MAAGHFSSTTASFGGEVLIKAGSDAYSYDAFLWNMSSDGTTLWAVRGGGTLVLCD